MRKVLLFPLLWIVFISSAYAEAESNSAAEPVDATSMEVKTAPAIRKWYAGGAIGLAVLTGGRDTTPASDAYYKTYGYSNRARIPHGWFGQMFTDLYDAVAFEGKIYGGYRLLDFLDVELGYTRDNNWYSKHEYYNYTTGDHIESSRRIKAQALYLSASLRPFPEGYGHGLYFKLGGHSSELNISNTVTGTPANLNTIAAGDILPDDGTSRGYGSLYGLGYDFRTAKYGAVRLEWSHFNKLGGTSYGKSSVNIGYHGNF